jgi:hypothetical protein
MGKETSMSPRRWLPYFAALAAFVPLAAPMAGCGRDSRAAARTEDREGAAAAPHGNCGHSLCGDNFFIDIEPGAGCAPGATCAVNLTLVAIGAFHINDEYPYKFKADDAPSAQAIEFLGTDGAGKNVFSKLANDWRKKDEKTGTMTVKWRSSVKGDKTIAGVFKLSVCSAQSCQLEQQPVSTTVAVR